MATVQEIQAELDPQGFNTKLLIQSKFTVSTTDSFFVLGGTVRPGKTKWCTTTNTDNAATQAAAITSQMTS